MYNERSGMAIYPTPTIGMVGLINDLAHITTQYFKDDKDLIYILGETKPEFGGSELQILQNGKIEGRPPALNLDTEKAHQDMVLNAIRTGLVKSAHDISEGGLAVAMAESLFGGNDLGASIDTNFETAEMLYAESQSRFILSITPENKAAFEQLIQPAVHVGEVNTTGKLVIKNNGKTAIEASVANLQKSWEEAIPCLLK